MLHVDSTGSVVPAHNSAVKVDEARQVVHLRQLAVVVWPVTSVACQEPTQRVRSPTVSTPDEEEDKRRMNEETMCVGAGETYTHAYAHTHTHTRMHTRMHAHTC